MKRSISPLVLVFCGAFPAIAAAGYSESAYYSQGTYYSQSTYQTVFTGNVSERVNFTVTGNISKGAGSFVIDHPLDPVNKLLYHSFLESPDAKNFYDGIATLGGSGSASIQLPDYFMVLNKDFRYQVKPIGNPMPSLFVEDEIANNQFTITGGTPGGRVSWQVTGIRHDPYIEAHPIVTEVKKGTDPKMSDFVSYGGFLHEGLYPDAIPPNIGKYIRAVLDWFKKT